MLAVVHCVVFVCLPRVYLGLHYPTDVIGGAAIGAFCAWLFTRPPIRTRLAPLFLRFMEHRPAVGYMLAFLFFFELATMFDEPRLLAVSVIKHLHPKSPCAIGCKAANRLPVLTAWMPTQPSAYYQSRGVSEADLKLMRRIDELHRAETTYPEADRSPLASASLMGWSESVGCSDSRVRRSMPLVRASRATWCHSWRQRRGPKPRPSECHPG